MFETLVTSETIKWFIKRQHLVDIKYYAVPTPDLRTIKIRAGDYDENELAELMGANIIMADLIHSYSDHAMGKKIIVFAVNRSHVKQIVQRYNSAGFEARYVDTSTPKYDRQKIIQDFRNNKFKILCNVNIFTEGFDCPDIDGVQLARPTKSLTLYMQQVGRCMRPAPGKDFGIILDNAGLWREHGLPKMDREWRLYGSDRIENGDFSSNILGLLTTEGRSMPNISESRAVRLIEIDEVTDLRGDFVIQPEELEQRLMDIKVETMEERIFALEKDIFELKHSRARVNTNELKFFFDEKIEEFKKELQELKKKLQPQRFERVLDMIITKCNEIIDDNDVFLDGDKDDFLQCFIEPGLVMNQQSHKENRVAKKRDSDPLPPKTESSVDPQIEIFRRSREGKTANAIFNLNTHKVTYKGETDLSVSAAAQRAHYDQTGKRTSLNGWIFWMYINDDGHEVTINNLRHL